MGNLIARPSIMRGFSVIALAILIAMLIVSTIIVVQGYRDYSEKVAKQLEAEAVRIDRTLVLEVEHSAYLLQSLGRQILHFGTDDLNSVARLLRSFDPDATVHNVLTWTDRSQQVIVSSNLGILERSVDVSDRDYIKFALKEPWTIHIGRPIQGRVSEKWVIPVALGITDYTGRYVGTITISLDINSLAVEISNVIRDNGVSFALLSNTFSPLTEVGPIADLTGTYFTRDSFTEIDFEANPIGSIETSGTPGLNTIYNLYQTSVEYPYILLLAIDSDRSKLEIAKIVGPRLLQLIMVALFLLAILWLIRSRVIAPIEELTQTAAGMALGHPYHELSQGGPEEIEKLSKTIKRLDQYIVERRRVEEERTHKLHALKRAKEYAELRNRIKLEFISTMSQELRGPLNTINGFSESMVEEVHGKIANERYAEYAGSIFQSGKQLESLIEDVLALAKAEAGLSELREKPVDLEPIIRRAVRLLSERLQGDQITVDIELPGTLPMLRVDELRLKQILVNLLSGAAAAVGRGGSINIRAKMTPGGREAPGEHLVLILSQQLGTSGASDADGNLRPILRQSALRLPLTRALAAMLDASLEVHVSESTGNSSNYLKFPPDRVIPR